MHIYCEEADPLHKVTIIPGDGRWSHLSLPWEDKHSYSKQYILTVSALCLAEGWLRR